VIENDLQRQRTEPRASPARISAQSPKPVCIAITPWIPKDPAWSGDGIPIQISRYVRLLLTARPCGSKMSWHRLRPSGICKLGLLGIDSLSANGRQDSAFYTHVVLTQRCELNADIGRANPQYSTRSSARPATIVRQPWSATQCIESEIGQVSAISADWSGGLVQPEFHFGSGFPRMEVRGPSTSTSSNAARTSLRYGARSAGQRVCEPRRRARPRRKIEVGRCGTACGASKSGPQPMSSVEEPGKLPARST
jgi:hypothetical protein